MPRIIRAQLNGPGAGQAIGDGQASDGEWATGSGQAPGGQRQDGISPSIAAADVAKIILGLERAIARAAYLVLNRPRRGTGRHQQAIESAARLTFVGIDLDTFTELLGLPDISQPSDDELPFTVADLSSQAFDRVLEAIRGTTPEVDVELARAIAQLATELGIGDRNERLVLRDDHAEERAATIDLSVRTRTAQLSQHAAPAKEETLVGVLVEADFEDNTARLRLPDGSAVLVRYAPDMADDIQDALRSRAGFECVVRYEPRTSQATSVEVRAVVRNTQLVLIPRPLRGE